ncbi:MAG: hypothetical protein HY721_09250 [Planctomycetes bacterium]|nr:hypothetical protein [Planctomycetota bacterium]
MLPRNLYVSGLTVLVLAVLPPSAATELFFDDFESYLDDTELQDIGGWAIVEVNTPIENAAWTILNPGGRLPPPTRDGSPSTGNFIISDSDAAGGNDITGSEMSHDIWSPSFSCLGATVVWLHLDCTFEPNNNGVCVFDIDVSTDGGTNWNNVFRRVAPARVAFEPVVTLDNADGFFGRLDVDISTQAAGKPNVMFRLRQFEPEDDWWLAVDNVVVDDVPHAGGSANLLFESFDGGIPATWTARSEAVPPNTGDSTWTANDVCRRSLLNFNGGKFPDGADGRRIHRFDSKFAIADSGCKVDKPEDEYLVTPSLDCTKATAVFLHFKSTFLTTGPSAAEVLLSLDGGLTFETESPVFSYTRGAGILQNGGNPDVMYNEHLLPVPDAVGKSSVAFGFHFGNQALQDTYWAIDDVKVTVNGLTLRDCANREFRVLGFDPGTRSVGMTWKSLAGDEGFRVVANGQKIADLPAEATSYTDANPPAGEQVVYSLQTLKGGNVEFECSAPPIRPILCPGDLSCCVNQRTRQVTLRWSAGVNVAGSGYRITRKGVPVKTVPFTETSYVDTTALAPGEYDYQLSILGGNPAQCPAFPLKCRAVVTGGDQILFDDFDCYVNDSVLVDAGWEVHEENSPRETAQWTVTNPGTRDNPPLRNGTPSRAKFLISDSDAAANDDDVGTGMSHDIWSPPFDCTGKGTVWLHMDATLVLNNNGKCVFDVDVSADGGATWNNVFRRVAPGRNEAEPLPLADIPEGFEGGPQVGNADGFFGPLDLDISEIAANKPNVRFRLRDFEPDDDWWMAVDNVLVDTKPWVGGERVLLERESFDGGIPGDWGVLSLDDLAPWTTQDPCNVSLLHANGGVFPDSFDGRGLHHLDNEFAIVAGDATCASHTQDEMLITPALDCTGTTNVFLHFKSGLMVTDAVAEVLLSLDGGGSFDAADPVFSYHRGGGLHRDAGNAESIYNEYILEVPRAAGQSKVAFAFHYSNPAPRTAFWAIDDVAVTVDGGITAPKFHRGDADDNGRLELTDAIRILGFLFLGGAAPTCQDAADADDNAQLQLTDAIRVLGYLFLGGLPPAPPGPPGGECGPDAGGELGCDSYNNC